ncbi:fungal-specific transcription factor domain-containing protein [Fusarium oxysporum f. sp. albedinis]|nr:fungal-specific transcription factor domain-containing protein [Fusarium oxysporum f. sp. albedinis]
MVEGNAHEPSWLVGESFDINALASCTSAVCSPWELARVPIDLAERPADKNSNGSDHTEASAINIRRIVRDRWHTRPAVEAAHPYAPTILKCQDQVDEAYRAALSHRLHPCLHDDVLPPADFLNICIKLYFAKFQPVFPIIHAPSFRPSSENALLLLSICSIGALFVGSANAAACGRKIFAKLNRAILASWEVYLYRGGHEALAVTQAVALGQTFGMLSRNSNDLLMTESFHGTIISWARQAGMFQVKNSLQPTDRIPPDELETAWMSWTRTEETVRFLLALHIHDYQFASIFHHEPLLRHEAGRLPQCGPDELFVASTAAQWYSKIKSLRSSVSFSKPQDHDFPDRPAVVKFNASMNAYALLAGYSASICEARCAALHEETIVDFRCRVSNWYKTYSPGIYYPGRDPHCLMVLWHEAFMLLYVSFDWIERVVGREGQPMLPEDLARIRSWVAGLQGQRCAIHAMLIHKSLQALSISAEPAIHAPKALFHAGLVMYCHAKFRASNAPHVEIDIPELRRNELGHFSTRTTDPGPLAVSLDQLDSSTLYNVTDLLRRQGHWELSRRLASVVEVLIDDLTGS